MGGGVRGERMRDGVSRTGGSCVKRRESKHLGGEGRVRHSERGSGGRETVLLGERVECEGGRCPEL